MDRTLTKIVTFAIAAVILAGSINGLIAATVSLRSGGYFCGTDGTCMWFKPGDSNWLFERFTYIMGYADCPQYIDDWRANSPGCRLIVYTSGTDLPAYKSYSSNSYNGGRKSSYIRDRMVQLGDIEENAYMHFYNDTRIRNWNGSAWDTVTIPGTYSMVITPADSVSRVPNSYTSYLFTSGNTYSAPTRLSPNFTNPNLRQAYVEYITQAFTDARLDHFPGISGHWDGIYFDNYSPLGMQGSHLVDGGLIVETGTSPSNLLTFGTDAYGDWGWGWMLVFGRQVRDTLLTSASWSADGKRKVLAYNVGVSNKSVYHIADSSGADAINYEFAFDPVYCNSESFYRLENLYTRDSTASRNGVTHFWTSRPRTSYGNGSTTKRNAIYNNLCFWYTARAESSWVFMRPEPGNAYGVFYNPGFDTLAWIPAMEYDLGEPSARYELVASGSSPDQAGKIYKVFRREYQYGTVYMRPRDAFDAKWGETSTAVTVDLGGQYRQLLPDGTLGSIITQLNLPGAAGAIVIPAGTGDCGTPPTVPSLLSPGDGTMAADNQPTLCVSNSTQSGCTHPIRYHFQVSNSSSFGSILSENSSVTQGSSSTCWGVINPLAGGQTYYWRVRAGNSILWSDWSATRTFTVPNAAPSAPVVASPANGNSVSVTQPILSCLNASDPDGSSLTYQFQVSTSSGFGTIIAQSGMVNSGNTATAWTVTPALNNLSSYYWRARAYDGVDYSNWSAGASFTVNQSSGNAPPSAPQVSSPENGAVIGSVVPTLTISNSSDPDGNSLTYQFEVYNSSQTTLLIQSPAVSQGAGLTTSWTLSSSLPSGQQYFWRVRASDSQAWSGWMPWASFEITTENSAPTVPIAYYPLDGDTLTGSQHTLVLRNSSDADGDVLSYDFALFSDSLLTNYVEVALEVPETPIYTIHKTTHTLEHGRPYWWRVRANDGTVWSNWCTAQKFYHYNLSLDADDALALLRPTVGATLNEARPLLSVGWSGGDDSALVYFEIATDSDFREIIDAGNAVGSDRQASWRPNQDLEAGVTFYWRAQRINGPYSEVRYFSIEAPVFVSPNPFSYLDGAITFHNIPTGALVEIFTPSGDRVISLQPDSNEFQWQVLNSSGEKLGPGVYLYYVRVDNEIIKDKFVVVR